MSAFDSTHGSHHSMDEATRRIQQLEAYIKGNGLTLPTPPGSPLLPDGSIHITPYATPASTGGFKPEVNYKLGSQVLTVTREGMLQKSLADILAETAGRLDSREPDTPAKGSSGASFETATTSPRDKERRKSVGDKPAKGMVAQVKKAVASRTSPTTSPTTSPLKKKKDKGLPPLDRAMLDRIATVHSLAALRTDKMMCRIFPPTSRIAMDYIAMSYNDIKNVFTHDMDKFYNIMKTLCVEMLPIVQSQVMYQKMKSPCYTFGDIHGNYRDVSYFLENIINFLDLAYTPCNLIFLGDYVDRGPYGLEVLCLLFSLKISAPKKVCLLRGNHEDPLVNGDIRHYGDSAFQRQCQKAFGPTKGLNLWKQINEVFRHFPLAADIDGKIFCCHGGIPRFGGGEDRRLEILMSPKFPHLEVFSTFEPVETEDDLLVQMASDLCWSDPKDFEDEGGYWELNEFGFGHNSRGDGVICFGEKAVDDFCEKYGFQYIFRAHQEKSDGLKLCKSARVITIFSSSDYEGHQNGAGVLFANDGEIRMIMKTA
eukprot:TRINITY_DN4104_c0_g1_i2.p1 TRINITY_DN4104_c0_g1~~TRINITY_DN4104_c0_g1_i2.p1  ORF type:complete len:539 (+),score=122.69 TRINITY_DN4104_c0_g1_i2:106-1722(+)